MADGGGGWESGRGRWPTKASGGGRTTTGKDTWPTHATNTHTGENRNDGLKSVKRERERGKKPTQESPFRYVDVFVVACVPVYGFESLHKGMIFFPSLLDQKNEDDSARGKSGQ